MKKLLISTLMLTMMMGFTHAQIPARTTTAKKTVSSRPFPSATVFTPSPALQQAFNWWLAIKPTEFGYTYDKVPERQSFYDSAIYKFYLTTTIDFNNLPFSPGLVRLQPDSLFHLPAMPNLREVYLSHNTFTSKAFQYLSSLPNLTSVGFPLSNTSSLSYSFTYDVTDKNIAALVQNTSLQHLHLAKCNLLTDNAFTILKNNTKLKTLSLYDCNNLTDKFFLSLQGCSQLETLSFISSGNITIDALNNLYSIMPTLPALRTINFRAGTTLTFKYLSDFTAKCRQAGYNVTGVW